MSHSANPAQYHPRYHKPEPQEAHVDSINAQDKFDQAVKFLVMAREMDPEEAAEMVKAEGAEKFLAERDAPPQEGDAPEPEAKQKPARVKKQKPEGE